MIIFFIKSVLLVVNTPNQCFVIIYYLSSQNITLSLFFFTNNGLALLKKYHIFSENSDLIALLIVVFLNILLFPKQEALYYSCSLLIIKPQGIKTNSDCVYRERF